MCGLLGVCLVDMEGDWLMGCLEAVFCLLEGRKELALSVAVDIGLRIGTGYATKGVNLIWSTIACF